MAARATSSATIAFGLVSIPIKVYTATSSKAVRFSMLHAADKARLKQHYTCTKCEQKVERADTVKGYEYARGQYVVLTAEELEALEHASDKSIEIQHFVAIDSVDPVYFDKANLLGPDKGGHKAYQLLCAAMRRSRRVAVGRFAARGKHHLVLLRPHGEGLAMHTLFYADEVRSFAEIDTGGPMAFEDAELELAEQLISQLAGGDFDPEQYEDTYRQSVLAVIDRKVAGEEVVIADAAPAREQVIDLVAALKQSLGQDAPADGGKRRKPAKAKGRSRSGSEKHSASHNKS
ncbi:MAG: Ku protein [Myxococcales bacterium FL481]|nr:MAG: Ku protein [Myxococcales bacterium FL481]